jgi:hypothetical protein
VNKEISGIIKQMSRMKYGRDLAVVNDDIRARSQLDKKEEVAKPQGVGFAPMGF